MQEPLRSVSIALQQMQNLQQRQMLPMLGTRRQLFVTCDI